MSTRAAGAVPLRRALVSVSDTTGLSEFCRVLVGFGVELVATAGTRAHLSKAGLTARPAEELTGIGSWFGGRIKTLHPGLLGGILYPRTPAGEAELAKRGLIPIDIVVVNLYPFEERVARREAREPLEESIDIGGITLIRSAAKNHDAVTVVVDPSQYPAVAEELRRSGGAVSATTRRALARRAFERSRDYDRAIADALGSERSPGTFPPALLFARIEPPLRYGENPHQPAAPYRLEGDLPLRPAAVHLLQGDSLSYNNLVDLDTALAIVGEFPEPAAAVVKHASPCGVASASDAASALAQALATDPVSRYGCVIALNRPFTAPAAAALSHVFVDCLAAPKAEADAREAVRQRKKLKLLETEPPSPSNARWEARSALGRLLVQEADRRSLAREELRLVTSQRAAPAEIDSLLFAWRVARHARSNAIVLAQGSSTVGIGAGQPSRVKAVELAVEIAGERAKGAVLASDAFFPFADGVEVAGRAGIRAIVQPGGSIRDAEVIRAAEASGIAMYFTGWRVFRH